MLYFSFHASHLSFFIDFQGLVEEMGWQKSHRYTYYRGKYVCLCDWLIDFSKYIIGVVSALNQIPCYGRICGSEWATVAVHVYSMSEYPPKWCTYSNMASSEYNAKLLPSLCLFCACWCYTVYVAFRMCTCMHVCMYLLFIYSYNFVCIEAHCVWQCSKRMITAHSCFLKSSCFDSFCFSVVQFEESNVGTSLYRWGLQGLLSGLPWWVFNPRQCMCYNLNYTTRQLQWTGMSRGILKTKRLCRPSFHCASFTQISSPDCMRYLQLSIVPKCWNDCQKSSRLVSEFLTANLAVFSLRLVQWWKCDRTDDTFINYLIIYNSTRTWQNISLTSVCIKHIYMDMYYFVCMQSISSSSR